MAIVDDKKIEEEVVEEPSIIKDDNDIIDIDLSATASRKFRINGDNSKIIELNPSDLSIISRIEETTTRLNKCVEEVKNLADSPTDTDEELYALGKQFSKVDDKMRECVDYIFQSNVSEVCIPKGKGSMYDPFKGRYRFEHIIEALLTFYEANIQKEYKKMQSNINSRTSKYTKKKR